MDKYIIYLNDSNLIHSNPEVLINKCVLWSNNDFEIYKSFNYVGGTGFTKTVDDEIRFILECQKAAKGSILCYEEFIQAWDFKKYLNYDLDSLSGGWNKYLGIALFSNYNSQNKIYIDMGRHLSDQLLTVFFKNIDATLRGTQIFIEYDINLLLDVCKDLKPLYDHGDKLSKDEWAPLYDNCDSETNYD